MKRRKRPLPEFLTEIVDYEGYMRWLNRKAAAHVRRDRKRKLKGVAGAAYRDAIHAAVVRSNGRDAYTGEVLAWHLISQYDNADAKHGRHHYKAHFALLPRVDHVEASATGATFNICAWRTNDAKHDMSIEDFLVLCQRVLAHAGFRVHRDG